MPRPKGSKNKGKIIKHPDADMKGPITTLADEEYIKDRKKIDTLFKSQESVRRLIGNSFKRNGYKKNTKTEKIVSFLNLLSEVFCRAMRMLIRTL